MRSPRALFLVVAATLVLGAAAAAAPAQDAADEARQVEADVQRLRNNPFLADEPDRVRSIVLGLLDRKTPEADAALRDLLRDPRTHANVVEQIVRLTLFVEPHRLLPEVVERLRPEVGSPLDRAVEPAFLHVDADVVRMLADLARDAARPVRFRAEAALLLGRTGDGDALETLAELWRGPDREIREAARAAFDEIVPGGAATPDEARAFIDGLRKDDVPLAEALRRLLRERGPSGADPAAQGVPTADYAALALEMLPKAALDQVVRLYVLASPVAEVRAAAVKRLAEFPYDDAADPDARLRTAHALFGALRREDSAAVEDALLATLAVLAPAARGNVGTDEMDALLVRLRPGPAVARATRLLATRLVGELRDERALPALEEAYRDLGDADADARLAILSAVQQIPSARTAWLVSCVEGERRPEILRKLVVLLGRSRDPEAVRAFAALLADGGRTDADLRREAAKALATQWAARSDVVARDALVATGLVDPDPGVRATSAGALGIAGPGREETLAALLRALRTDRDPDVRRAAARSAVLLDEAAATAAIVGRLAEDDAVFDVYRDHYVDAVRRDQAPDRALAAADALVAAGLRPLAIALVDAATAGALDTLRGRPRLQERLARLYLDEGRPADAEPVARALLAAETRDGAVRDRYELLLARALTASGAADRLADAERRLTALRPRLADGDAAECAATLADCRLRRGDAVGAIVAVESVPADAKDVPEGVSRRMEILRADATRRVAEQRARVSALVDRLGGDGDAEARAALRSPDLAGFAAWHLSRELAATRDFAAVHRLLVAVEALTGSPAPKLAVDASAAQIAAAVATAREALAKVPGAPPGASR